MTKTGFEILQTVGLTGNETKVFLKLLESGTTTPGDLIVKTGLHRSRVYDCLNKLIEMGLVSYVIQDNKKFVRAEDTKKLLEVIEAKENELKRQKKKLSQAISSLESKRGKQGEEQEVMVFRGRNGIKSVLADWLNERKEVLAIGAYGEHAETLDYYLKYILPGFHKERIAKGIRFRFIFPEESKKRGLELKDLDLTEVKILRHAFASATSTQIYGDKVAIIIWTAEPMSVIIKNKEFARSQRNYFNVLWRIGQRLRRSA